MEMENCQKLIFHHYLLYFKFLDIVNSKLIFKKLSIKDEKAERSVIKDLMILNLDCSSIVSKNSL